MKGSCKPVEYRLSLFIAKRHFPKVQCQWLVYVDRVFVRFYIFKRAINRSTEVHPRIRLGGMDINPKKVPVPVRPVEERLSLFRMLSRGYAVGKYPKGMHISTLLQM